jgi:hypothetical protein
MASHVRDVTLKPGKLHHPTGRYRLRYPTALELIADVERLEAGPIEASA